MTQEDILRLFLAQDPPAPSPQKPPAPDGEEIVVPGGQRGRWRKSAKMPGYAEDTLNPNQFTEIAKLLGEANQFKPSAGPAGLKPSEGVSATEKINQAHAKGEFPPLLSGVEALIDRASEGAENLPLNPVPGIMELPGNIAKYGPIAVRGVSGAFGAGSAKGARAAAMRAIGEGVDAYANSGAQAKPGSQQPPPVAQPAQRGGADPAVSPNADLLAAATGQQPNAGFAERLLGQEASEDQRIPDMVEVQKLLSPEGQGQAQAPQEDYYSDPENYLKQLMDAEKARQAEGLSTGEGLSILLAGLARGFGVGHDPYDRAAQIQRMKDSQLDPERRLKQAMLNQKVGKARGRQAEAGAKARAQAESAQSQQKMGFEAFQREQDRGVKREGFAATGERAEASRGWQKQKESVRTAAAERDRIGNEIEAIMRDPLASRDPAAQGRLASLLAEWQNWNRQIEDEIGLIDEEARTKRDAMRAQGVSARMPVKK